jgi:M6 family metalloprotease-like protein
MKTKKIIIIFFLLGLTIINAQEDIVIQDECNLNITLSEQQEATRMPLGYAPNGKIFTPNGMLRILIIYAGFDSPSYTEETHPDNQQLSNWSVPSSHNNHTSLPSYVNPDTGDADDFVFDEISDFSTVISTNPNNTSLSRYYHDMSSGSFQFLADVLKDPNTGKPVRINIDATSNNPDFPTDVTGWSQCNKRVMTKMMQLYPNFDWSPYDNRTNKPNFQFDNSISLPDNKPDYVVIIYRFSHSWTIKPVTNMPPGGQYSVLNGLGGINYNGYTFDSAGFTWSQGGKHNDRMRKSFLHEIAHELYSAPHYMGANSAMGTRFTFPNLGWGMVSSASKMIDASNSWERWLLGWIDLTSNNENTDIQSKNDLNESGIYTIRDFITTDDVIRLKIPNTQDQFLWIENHQKLSVWDHTPISGLAPSTEGEIIPDFDSGLFMFIENIQATRENISTSMVSTPEKVNGIKILNAAGNFDYTHSLSATEDPEHLWNNILFTFERGRSNPLSGVNPFYAVPDDYPNPPTSNTGQNDEIKYHYSFNGGSSNSEAYGITKETNGTYTELLYAAYGGRNSQAINHFNRRSSVFQTDDEVSLSGNIPLVNFPLYNKSEAKKTPYYLNGVKVKVLSYNPMDKSYQIKIEFDSFDVGNDKRWSGNIVLNDNSNDERADINILERVTVTIDKSGMPNRHTLLNSKFINPTIFTCSPNSKFVQNEKSVVNVNETSTLHLKNDSKYVIENNATLVIGPESTLKIDACAELVINGNGQLVIVDGAHVEISDDAILSFENALENTDIGTNIIIPFGHSDLRDYLPPSHKITSLSPSWDNKNYKIFRDVILENGSNLRISNSTILFAETTNLIVSTNSKLRMSESTFTSLNHCNNSGLWQGIIVQGNKLLSQTETNQGVVEINRNVVIEHARIGVLAANFSFASNRATRDDNRKTGGIVRIDNAIFRDNIIGVEIPAYSLNNTSYIKNSLFETTDYLNTINEIPNRFISLYDVGTIDITGNMFINHSGINPFTDLRNLPLQGNGIVSFNASMFVNDNNFENLYKAIDSQGTNTRFCLTRDCLATDIDNNNFVNNWNAIYLNNNNSAKIISNDIQIFRTQIDGQADGSSGLYILASNGFQIENNNLYASSGRGFTNGIYIQDCNAANKIYKNYFNDLFTGIFAKGKNTVRSPLIDSTTEGLQFICNEFQNNSNDIYVDIKTYIAPIQGSDEASAGNIFNPICASRDKEFNNQGSYSINYIAENTAQYQPNCNHNISLTITKKHNTCESNISIVGLIGKYKRDNSNASTDLHKAFLIRESEAQLDRNYELIDFYLSKGDVLNAQKTLRNSVQKFDLTESELKNHNKLSKLYKLKIDIITQNKTWDQLNKLQIETLKSLAEDEVSLVALQAKAILSFVNNIDYGLPIPSITKNSIHKKEIDNLIQTFKVYPNPTDGNFTIDLNGYSTENMSIQIVDIRGLVIKKESVYKNNKLTINSSSWHSGVYFVSLLNHQELIKTLKIIVK